MEGYSSERNLPQIEINHFVPFMRLALLCNCSWRFVKFNVPTIGKEEDDEFPEEAKDSYVELQNRIKYLHDTDVIAEIDKLLKR